jgi:hypothetical protein
MHRYLRLPKRIVASLVALAGLITAGACSSSAPTGPQSGCPALATCCMSPKLTAGANAECSEVLSAGDDMTCDNLLTEYELDGYCGMAIHVIDGGTTATLGPDCAALLTCCQQATFSGSQSDCSDTVYGGSQANCASVLTSYASGGKCGDMFDAAVPPVPTSHDS